MLLCSFKVTLGKRIVCQTHYITHYLMLQTVSTKATFSKMKTYKQCISSHESKYFLDQLVV